MEIAMLREIMLDGRDTVLRKVSRPLTHITPEDLALLDDMAETMYHYKGVGLAAPQTGVLKRLVVADAGQGLIRLINPVILSAEGRQSGRESCLSIPGVTAAVIRPQSILVDTVNEQGRHMPMAFSGIAASIICHEIDHLDGVLFTDRAEPDSIINTVSQKEQTE